MVQRLIPGAGYVDETGAAQRSVPSIGYVSESAVSGVTIACFVGNASATGSTATVTGTTVIACTTGNASAAGSTATVTSTSGTTINCVTGNATANGSTALVTNAMTINCVVGDAGANGSTATIPQFISSDVLVNNTGTIRANTGVFWTWTPAGRIGSMSGKTPTDGAGTTGSDGRLVTNITPATGRLDVAVRNASAVVDDVYYQAFP